MSPSAKRYCALLRSHADLVHLATPLWFDAWPDSALAVIAAHELAAEKLVFPEGTLLTHDDADMDALGTVSWRHEHEGLGGGGVTMLL